MLNSDAMGWRTYAKIAGDIARNAVVKTDLTYVVGPGDWVIRRLGMELTTRLKRKYNLSTHVTTTPWGVTSTIIHFGSLPTMIGHHRLPMVHKAQKTVLTVFHIVPERKLHAQQALQQNLNIIHTSCTTTKAQLTDLGVLPAKVHVIPLGINTAIFSPATKQQKEYIRQKLGISPENIVIGSFQKDGKGWAAGSEPKWEKGPDILVKVLDTLAQHYPIHMLLIGPSRGYVCHELERLSVPYTNLGFIKPYEMIRNYYQALDAYVISSRMEGGPLALLEAWAAGVPVVSTKVGMVSDIAREGHTALIASPEDHKGLVQALVRLIENPALRNKLIAHALQEVKQYDLTIITERYYRELYKPFLS